LASGKSWVFSSLHAELGPIFDDPMVLIIDSKLLPGYIRAVDVLQALKLTGATPSKTTVELIFVGRRRFFLVQTFEPQFASKVWIGGLEMAYGKVVPVELACLWKSNVLKSQIPNLPQEKAYNAIVKQNPRLLSSIKAAKGALRAVAKGKDAQGAVSPHSLIFLQGTNGSPSALSRLPPRQPTHSWPELHKELHFLCNSGHDATLRLIIKVDSCLRTACSPCL
jgi:hypothetical protein